MTRSQLHAGIAVGSAVLAAALMAFLRPFPPESAQSQSRRICREQGVNPGSAVYEYCLSQATRALEWGEPRMARTFAQVAADASEACLSYGLHEQTAGLKACIDKETSARANAFRAHAEPPYRSQTAVHR